jgi:hypothetical protein
VRLAYSECWKERNELRDCDTERCGKKRHGVIKKCPMTCFLCGGEITCNINRTHILIIVGWHLRNLAKIGRERQSLLSKIVFQKESLVAIAFWRGPMTKAHLAESILH